MRECRTLAVVDGQPIYRKGLVALLEELGYRVPIVASCWEDHIDQSRRTRVDLVVVNLLDCDEAFAAIAWIRNEQHLPVLTIALPADREAHFRAFRAGARGLVDTHADERTLRPALHDLFTAGIHCNPYMEAYLDSAHRVPEPTPPTAGQLLQALSDREHQVLRWLLHTPRLTLLRIGKRLHIKRTTVVTHVMHIAAKLGVHGRNGILHFVWHHKIPLAPPGPPVQRKR